MFRFLQAPALFLALLSAAPAMGADPSVGGSEALKALAAARGGEAAAADALAGRPFRLFATLSDSDWIYEPAFAALTYRPAPIHWRGLAPPGATDAIGFRLNPGRGEPLGVVVAPPALDWLQDGEGLAAVRLPVPPAVEAAARATLRLEIEGVFTPLAGGHIAACAPPGQGCVLGARIDDLMLVYGPDAAPHILARWDPATLE